MARKSSARPARTFRVTRVEVANTVTGATFPIPGLVVTLAELRAMVACAPHTANVVCEDCDESVADCPDTRGLVQCPDSWSWRSAGLVHQDGLVAFRG